MNHETTLPSLMREARFQLERISEIEGIRGVLSVLVVVGHFFPSAIPWFWGCMEVFFCISGFVITRILNAHWEQTGFVRTFFVRRALRIWPMYFVAMLFTFLIIFFGGLATGADLLSWHPRWYEAVMPVFFIQNTERVFNAKFAYLPGFEHSWSVAIEEQYYVLWPLVFALVWKLPLRILAGMCVVAVLGSTAVQMAGGDPWLLPCRFYGFALGAFLAWVEARARVDEAFRRRTGRVFKYLWLWPSLVLLPYVLASYSIISIDPDALPFLLQFVVPLVMNPYLNFALLALTLLGLLLFCKETHLSCVLRNRVLVYLGTISYSTYLLQWPIALFIAPYLKGRYSIGHATAASIGLCITVMLAHVSNRYVEQMAMKWKRRFAYSVQAGRPQGQRGRSVIPNEMRSLQTTSRKASPAPL